MCQLVLGLPSIALDTSLGFSSGGTPNGSRSFTAAILIGRPLAGLLLALAGGLTLGVVEAPGFLAFRPPIVKMTVATATPAASRRRIRSGSRSQCRLVRSSQSSVSSSGSSPKGQVVSRCAGSDPVPVPESRSSLVPHSEVSERGTEPFGVRRLPSGANSGRSGNGSSEGTGGGSSDRAWCHSVSSSADVVDRAAASSGKTGTPRWVASGS